jgi:hypothetical protein
MIQPADIMPTLLAASPDFRPAWEEHLRYWGDEAAGVYNDTAAFVHYLVERYEQGDRATFPLVFDAIENFMVRGTPDSRDVASLGILETLQVVASHYPFGSEAFEEYLGPVSKVVWNELASTWEGKSSLADVIRSEAGGTR